MSDDVSNYISSLLAEGYTEFEIREQLESDGYSEEVIDAALADTSIQSGSEPKTKRSSSDQLWKLQKYSWTAFYILLAGLYVISVRSGIYSLLGGFERVLLVTAGSLVLFHLGLGFYRLIRDGLGHRNLLSIGAVGFTLIAIGGGVVLGIEATREPISYLVALTWYVNTFMLILSISVGFFWNQHGYKAASYVVLFLVIFGAGWWLQSAAINTAYTSVEPIEYQTSVFQEGIYAPDQGEAFRNLLQATKSQPPPFTMSAVTSQAVGTVSKDLTFFTNLQSLANRSDTAKIDLVCSEAQIDNFQEKTVHPVKTPLFLQHVLKESYNAERENIIAAFKSHCSAKSSCKATQNQIAADVDRLINLQHQKYDAMKSVLPFSINNMPKCASS